MAGMMKDRGRHTLRNFKDNWVSRLRLSLDMTQEEFAREIKCGVATVRRMEAAGTLPRSEAVKSNVLKLARRANIEVE